VKPPLFVSYHHLATRKVFRSSRWTTALDPFDSVQRHLNELVAMAAFDQAFGSQCHAMPSAGVPFLPPLSFLPPFLLHKVDVKRAQLAPSSKDALSNPCRSFLFHLRRSRHVPMDASGRR